MAKHRASKRKLITTIRLEYRWLKNQWYAFWRPNLYRLIKTGRTDWEKYWRR